MFSKGLAVAVILLFVGTSIIPSVASKIVEKPSLPISTGNTLYVGGEGPGNYTHIQDAIDDASDGDTVYVYSGVYTYRKPGNRGCIDIFQKSINLVGEDKHTTILDGNWENGILHVDAERASISGFTIQNSGTGLDPYWFGIELGFNYVKSATIYDNIISGHEHGIIVWMGVNNIHNNVISDNECGIYIDGLTGSISNNIIENNSRGIDLVSSFYVIRNNVIQDNELGIVTDDCKARIIRNNFIENTKQAEWINCIMTFPFVARSRWRNNYWDDWQVSTPRTIHGSWWFVIFPFFIVVGPFPSFQFDWRPALQPYDIGV